MTDQGLKSLLSGCPLKYLTVNRSGLITDVGIREALGTLSLKFLSITCCVNVSKDMKDALRSSRRLNIKDLTAHCSTARGGGACTCQISNMCLYDIVNAGRQK